MSEKVDTTIAVIGIDIGKNSFHVVGHDRQCPRHVRLGGNFGHVGLSLGGRKRSAFPPLTLRHVAVLRRALERLAIRAHRFRRAGFALAFRHGAILGGAGRSTPHDINPPASASAPVSVDCRLSVMERDEGFEHAFTVDQAVQQHGQNRGAGHPTKPSKE